MTGGFKQRSANIGSMFVEDSSESKKRLKGSAVTKSLQEQSYKGLDAR